jgi:hypothetical protein
MCGREGQAKECTKVSSNEVATAGEPRVFESDAEAEVAGLFVNAKEGEILHTTLDEMGYPQEPTPIQTDNSTASGNANDTINQQLQAKQTILLPVASQTALSTNSVHAPLTCVSTGYVIV